MEQPEKIPCPFVYASGKHCCGHVVAVEAYKADISWTLQGDSTWDVGFFPRSHYHLFCSERGNHAGVRGQDDARLKFYFDQLPEELAQLVSCTGVRQS